MTVQSYDNNEDELFGVTVGVGVLVSVGSGVLVALFVGVGVSCRQ